MSGAALPAFTVGGDDLTVRLDHLPPEEAAWFAAERGGRVVVADAGEDAELHDRPTLSALVEQAALRGRDVVVGTVR